MVSFLSRGGMDINSPVSVTMQARAGEGLCGFLCFKGMDMNSPVGVTMQERAGRVWVVSFPLEAWT